MEKKVIENVQNVESAKTAVANLDAEAITIAAADVPEANADDTELERVQYVEVVVDNARAEFNNKFEYDEDEDRYVVLKDKNNQTVVSRKIVLTLDEAIPAIVKKGNDFVDDQTKSIEMLTPVLQEQLLACNNRTVARMYARFYEKTGHKLFSSSTLLELLFDAVLSVEVTVRYPGDVYFDGDVQKEVNFKHYRYRIVAAEFSDESIDAFKDAVNEEIADIKQAALEAKADAKAERELAFRAAATATGKSNDLPF